MDCRAAHGLCFSVPHGIAVPSSLKNIYKELKNDIPGWIVPGHGNLEAWAQQVQASLCLQEQMFARFQDQVGHRFPLFLLQGVLLLNTVLTVRPHEGKRNFFVVG
jgi:uracil DNA glycosylase